LIVGLKLLTTKGREQVTSPCDPRGRLHANNTSQ